MYIAVGGSDLVCGGRVSRELKFTSYELALVRGWK